MAFILVNTLTAFASWLFEYTLDIGRDFRINLAIVFFIVLRYLASSFNDFITSLSAFFCSLDIASLTCILSTASDIFSITANELSSLISPTAFIIARTSGVRGRPFNAFLNSRWASLMLLIPFFLCLMLFFIALTSCCTVLLALVPTALSKDVSKPSCTPSFCSLNIGFSRSNSSAFARTSPIVGASKVSYLAGSGNFFNSAASDRLNSDGFCSRSSRTLAAVSSLVSFLAGIFLRFPLANLLSLSRTSVKSCSAFCTPPSTLPNSRGSFVVRSTLTTIASLISATLKPLFFNSSLIAASDLPSDLPN